MTGISDLVREEADQFMAIPMYGFVESFNISASCAMTLYTLIHRLRKESDNWGLSQGEKDEIYLSWLRGTVKNAKKLEERWRKTTGE
jgi:tRNA (guanosine-2'-O-)-methyltransferase